MSQSKIRNRKSRIPRRSLPVAALVFAIAGFITGYQAGHHGGITSSVAPGGDSQISCYFSPHGGCTDAIVEQIDVAKQSIKVLAYSFTSQPIADALKRAKKRGVNVSLVLDKSVRDEHYEADACVAAGIETRVDYEHAIAHNKVMLIDGRTLITGSFNFTKAAEHANAENLLIIRDRPAVYSSYDANFELHHGHAQHY